MKKNKWFFYSALACFVFFILGVLIGGLIIWKNFQIEKAEIAAEIKQIETEGKLAGELDRILNMLMDETDRLEEDKIEYTNPYLEDEK